MTCSKQFNQFSKCKFFIKLFTKFTEKNHKKLQFKKRPAVKLISTTRHWESHH